MKNFFLKLSKVVPVNNETLQSQTPNPVSPSLISSESPDSRTPKLQKKFSLQTQSFSPRPILKRKSYASNKRRSLRSHDGEGETNSAEVKDQPIRRKTGKIHPSPGTISKSVEREEPDPAARKLIKKKEKLAELKKFEEKFDGNKLLEKAKGILKRSNTMLSAESPTIGRGKNSIRYGSFLQRNNESVSVIKIHKADEQKNDPLFFGATEDNKKIESNNNFDFMDDGKKSSYPASSVIAFDKKSKMRKQRVNYRLRYDDKYKHLKFIIFPDDPFRLKWDLIILL